MGISQNVETWPLPNANLGYFNIDTDGYVFQYSSGFKWDRLRDLYAVWACRLYGGRTGW